MVKFCLNHVALTVSNRDRSADFYSQWFAMDKRVRDDEHLLILSDSEGNLLALSEGDVPDALPRTNHFGFQVETPEQVLEMRQRALTGGLKEAEWQETGPTRLQLFDPDGYRVEVYSF